MKKLIAEKKKSYISLSRTKICTQKIRFCLQNLFLENVRLHKKFDLRLKKPKRLWGNFKITWQKFCVAVKKC